VLECSGAVGGVGHRGQLLARVGERGCEAAGVGDPGEAAGAVLVGRRVAVSVGALGLEAVLVEVDPGAVLEGAGKGAAGVLDERGEVPRAGLRRRPSGAGRRRAPRPRSGRGSVRR
jgi:hypothetical protein